MPFGVYCDWLEDMGWDASEMRLEDDAFVGDMAALNCCDGRGNSFGHYGYGGQGNWAYHGVGDGYINDTGFREWYQFGGW